MRAGALTRNAGGDETEEMALSALVDEYPQVRREAVRALARLGGHRASVALATRATEDPSAEVREEAVSALAALLSRGAADQRAE
jgi:HEAT repeat protein